MSNRRMAGEKLDERFGEGFTERVKPDGLQDPTAQGGYSKKELLAEFRGRDKGVNIDEGEGNLVDKFQGLVDSGEKFNGQAQSYLESHGINFGGGDSNKPDAPTEPPSGGKPPSNPTEPPSTINPPSPFVPPGSTNQTVNQDNDINNTVNGDGNTVTIGQDNTVNQYAGMQAKSKAGSLMDNYVLNLRRNR